MTSCISELMEAGWARMQAEGIQQGRCSYFNTDPDGKIITACALGALVLGAGREQDYLAYELDARDVCPALTLSLRCPDAVVDRTAIEVIWNINDGWWITDAMREQAVEVDHNLTIPIPSTIQYLKENGL